MSFNELKQLIENSLIAGSFKLDTTGLPRLKDLGADYLAGATLGLSSASVESITGETITVKGTGIAKPFVNLAVEAEFYLVNNEAALHMKAVAEDKGWKLNKAIPAFDGTIADKIPFKDDAATKPTFYLLSDAKKSRPAGLTFEGTTDISKIPEQIRDFLGIDKEDVKGPVILKENGEKFVSLDLTGPDIVNVSLGKLGTFTLTFKITSDTIEDAVQGAKSVVPFIELSTRLPLKDEAGIVIAAKLTDFSSSLIFEARIGQGINLGLNAIEGLLDDINLKGVLPKNFDIEDYVDMAKLYMEIAIKEKKVKVAGFKLKSKKEWEIAKVNENPFNAGEIVLQYTISDPFNKEKRTTALRIDGEVTLTKNATLSIDGHYPDFKVHGQLKKGSVLSMKDFIDQFVGKSAGVPELLDVDKLDFMASGSDYSFMINVNGAWEINAEQSVELSVNDLSFDLKYESKNKKRTADFVGTLKIDSVDVNVTANYKAGDKKNGWEFTGKTGKDQPIPMGKFIAWLAKNFKAGNPPKWVESISLQNLHTRFHTGTKEFDFGVNGEIKVGQDETLLISMKFDMTQAGKGYQKTLSGEAIIKTSLFKLDFSSGEDENTLFASWSTDKPGGWLQFGDIVSVFNLGPLPAIPEGFDLALKRAALQYHFDQQAFVFRAVSANYGKAIFVAKKTDGKWIYAFGINMSTDVKLEKLPLIGTDLAAIAGKDVGLNGFRFIGVSATVEADEIKTFNKLISAKDDEEYPTLPESEKDLAKAVYAVIDLNLGADNSYEYEFNSAQKKQAALILTNTDGDDGIKWRDLQKNIGPVHFNRVGIGYKDKRVSLLIDAGLVFSVLKIEMLSLGVSNPIDKFEPAFELSGVNVNYKSGPVEIGGSFLKSRADNVTEYSGTAVISLQNFRMSALGSYASVENEKTKQKETSLFVFAMLTSPAPGGPPCFFVTGLAAGFGYNRDLKLPTIDTVADFPLVQAFVPGKESPFNGSDPKAALKVLMEKKLVPVAIGQNWLAAGIQFTSFQLVQSYALLSVFFGTNFEIGVIGVSEVSIPAATPDKKPETLVAYAQLALNARILPEKGVFFAEAKLTPASYILSKKCVLSGGFAFYLWTAPNEHEGDFVLTLGGYHPDFKVPEHYPKVPRLGFNWQVSKEILVKGAMYFALTPTCLMAGGVLEATYNSGNLKAWFIMGADFLIAWKPYYYKARMYVSFGVSYTFSIDLLFTTITETISVSIGADLSIWGPDFSGIARIHLWIISFDVSFGAANNLAPAAISWEEFKESFLPPSNNKETVLLSNGETVERNSPYCYSKPTDGLVKEMRPEDKSDVNWIVSRDRAAFESYTIYPAKEYSIKILDSAGNEVPYNVTNENELDGRNTEFGVGMVNVENDDFQSIHEVTINLGYKVEKNTRKYDVTAILRNVPKSLWEKRATGFDDDAMIENVLVGFRISPQSVAPKSICPIELENLEYFHKPYGHDIKFANPQLVPGPTNPEDGIKVLKKTIIADEVAKTRGNILNELKARGRKINPQVNVNKIAEHAEDNLLAPPVISYTYWKKSA